MLYPTTADKQAMLGDAIDAMREWLARDPEMPAADLGKLQRRTQLAVTAAVTTGGHVHTLISGRLGCVGLRVVEMITDQDAYGRALAAERHAAKLYVQHLARLVVAYVKRVAGPKREQHGIVTGLGKVFGVSRQTVDTWLDQPDGSPAEIS